MALKLYSDTDIQAIADAIRLKNGSSDTYTVSEMAGAISAISTGGITPSGTKTISITQNGTTTEDVTNYASAQITANVPNSYSVSDEGKVVVNGSLTAQTAKSITSNGTYDTTVNNSVIVNVPPSGAEYYKGVISFTDESATTLTLPAGVGDTDEFLLEFYLSKTGTVSGGVVTPDNVLTKHYTDGNWAVSGFAKRRITTALVTSIGNKVISYGYITYANQGTNNGTADVNINLATGMTLNANSIVLNVGRELCGEGVYNEYTYHLFISRGTR